MFNNSISAILLLLKLYHTLLLLLPKYSITLVLFLTYSSIPFHHLQLYFPPQSNSESLTLYNEMTKIVFALCKVNWFLTLIKLLFFFYDCYFFLFLLSTGFGVFYRDCRESIWDFPVLVFYHSCFNIV